MRRCALVVRFFRTPVFATFGEVVLEEACAGMIARDDAETATHREVYEELGIALRALEFIARVWSSPVVSTERVALCLATYRATDRIGRGGGVAGEHEG